MALKEERDVKKAFKPECGLRETGRGGTVWQEVGKTGAVLAGRIQGREKVWQKNSV